MIIDAYDFNVVLSAAIILEVADFIVAPKALV